MPAPNRCDVEDSAPTAFDHAWQQTMRQFGGRERKDAQEAFLVIPDGLGKPSTEGVASVVDQHVHLGVTVLQLGEDLSDTIRLGKVGDDRLCGHLPALLDIFGERVETFAASCDGNHVISFGRKEFGQATPNSAGGTGNQCGAPRPSLSRSLVPRGLCLIGTQARREPKCASRVRSAALRRGAAHLVQRDKPE